MAASDKKIYEFVMQLTAGIDPKLHSAFQTAMNTANGLKGTIQELNKTQSDIKSYQKTEEAVKKNREEKERLESATDRNEAAIEKVNKKLAEEESKLSAVSDRLKAAGVDTNNLSGENDRLQKSYDDIIKAQNDYSNAAAAVEKNKEAIAATRKELMTTVGVAAAAGAAIYKGFVEPAANFQAEMSNIGAITGATVQELDAMAAGMRKIATATGTPLMEIASNAKMLAEAGGDVDLMMEQLTHGTNLANATQSDMATTLDFLGSQMKTFGIEAEATQSVVDSFAYVSTLANLELSQLGEAFVNVGGSASAAGMSINDVNAFMVTFSNAGLKGSAAGTSLNAVLRNLSTPTGKAADALAELRIELYDQYGASRDMLEIMSDLENELGDMTDDLRNHYQSVIFDSVALKGWNMIVDEGVGSIYELRDELDGSIDAFDGAGQAAGMAATQLDNLKGDSARAKAAFGELAITIGDMFMPAVRGGTQSVADIVEKLTTFISENKETIVIVAKVVAGLVAAKIAFLAIKLAVLTYVGVQKTLIATKAAYNLIQTAHNSGTKLSTALTLVDTKTKAGQNAVMLMTAKTLWKNVTAKLAEAKAYIASKAAMIASKAAMIASTVAAKAAAAAQWLLNAAMNANPIGLIIAGVAALVAGIVLLVKNWDKVKEVFLKVWDTIKGAFSAALDWIKSNWKNIILFIINPFAGIFKYLYENFEGFRNFIDNVVDKIKGFFSKALEVIKAPFVKAFNWLKENWKTIILFIINPFAGIFKILYNKFEGFRNFVDGVMNKIKEIFGAIVGWFKENIIQPLINIFLPIIQKIGEIFAKLWEIVTVLFGVLASWFYDKVISPVIEFFKNLFEGVKNILEIIWDTIKGIFSAVSGWFSAKFTEAWEAIKKVFAGVKAFFDKVWGMISGVFSVVADWFSAKFTEAWENIKAVFSVVSEFFKGVWGMITGVFSVVADWFSAKFTEAWENVKKVFSGVKAFFKNIWDEIVSLFTSIGTAVGNAIGDAFKNVVNTIIGFAEGIINKFIGGINGAINLINKIPGVNIELLSLLEIPRLEKGSNYTPDTFIAGDVGGKGGELVTNAKGYKVFTAPQTTEILNNINRINTLNNTIHPSANPSANPDVPKIPAFSGIIGAIKSAAANRVEAASQKPLIALPAGRDSQQSVVLNYSPTINVDGDVPGDLDEKIKQNNEVLIQMVLEALRKAREDERRNEYA